MMGGLAFAVIAAMIATLVVGMYNLTPWYVRPIPPWSSEYCIVHFMQGSYLKRQREPLLDAFPGRKTDSLGLLWVRDQFYDHLRHTIWVLNGDQATGRAILDDV
jgi:hypothetical protein